MPQSGRLYTCETELTFKRHGCRRTRGTTLVVFSFMDLYIYSDESGTFDYIHNDYFVFGGLICVGDDQKQIASRKYAGIEQTFRNASEKLKAMPELKAALLSRKCKNKIYRSLRYLRRFAVIIHQKELNKAIFENRKHKQRYLDFAYKIALKKCLERMIKDQIIDENVENIYVNVDEHTTCTDGIYELREALLNEFKNGTFNSNYQIFFEPVFRQLRDIKVDFCDSKKRTLVRAADIIANHFYCQALIGQGRIEPEENAFVLHMPECRIDPGLFACPANKDIILESAS